MLILGGNGYLGSKVLSALVAEGGHHLVCTVRQTSDLTRIHPYIMDNRVRCINASADAIDAVMEYVQFDAVLNLAGSYGRKDMLYPNVIEANLDFPLRVLNCTVKRGINRFVNIGTALPNDLNMYCFSKKAFSDFGQYYSEKNGICFYNLRLEMFYGADEPRNRFIPSLIETMINGETADVTIGTQRRDIISVDDIVKVILGTLSVGLPGYQEFIVGTGIAPTISELVDYIWEETGRRSIVRKGVVAMRPNEPDCIGEPEKIRRLIDQSWHPKYWKDGICEMIQSMKE